MSSRNRMKIVEDIIADNASARVVDHLVEVLGYAVDRIAPTLARSSAFRLDDFATVRPGDRIFVRSPAPAAVRDCVAGDPIPASIDLPHLLSSVFD